MRHRGPPAAPRHRAPPPEERSLTGSREPRFLGSFPRADVVLDPSLPEIAFVGRSNVGKSSLLNALLGRRLARISGTPGKTRLLNVYEVTMGSGERGEVASGEDRASASHREVPLPSPLSMYFLDLPGYGYARAGKTDRAAFRRLLDHALERPGIAGVVWLLDLRHGPSAQDREMQAFLSAAGTRVLAALTKSDKLPRSQRLSQERALRLTLELDEDQVIATSVTTGDGIADLQVAIAGLVGGHSATREDG